jgi:SGNH hydrolase-like domain, acetyltransferase AlgX
MFRSVWLSSNSPFFNALVWEKYQSTKGKTVLSSSSGCLFYRWDLNSILKPWKYSDSNLRTICWLNDTLNNLGIKLLVVPVPDKEAINQSYSPFMVRTVSNQRHRFVEKLKQAHVNVVDLTPFFIENGDRDHLYRKNDTHWDQMGISLAAEIIVSKIPLLVPDRPCSNLIVKDTVVMEQGDLAKMIGDSTFLPQVCRMILTTDSVPINDSPSSNIMIFGDSFTKTYKQYGAGLGAWVAYYAKQPTCTYTSISANVNGPRIMLRLLRNRKVLPRVIVWVFVSRILYDKIEPL